MTRLSLTIDDEVYLSIKELQEIYKHVSCLETVRNLIDIGLDHKEELPAKLESKYD